MGRFFTNLHIKNSGGRDGFLKSFKNAATGWEICGKDEAERMLLLGFSENYVTVVGESYTDDPAAAENDAVLLSAALDTEAFTVCCIDSDAAVMCVYSRGAIAGETAIGMADAYGMETEPPEPELWEPLLKPGTDISALSDIWQDDAVFVEDLLCGGAELFGIDSGLMTAEFDYFEEGEPLYLRKNTECPIKLAPKPLPKQTKPSDSQTDDSTVTVFGQKYDIASTTKIEPLYSDITDEELIEAMPDIKRLTGLKELNLIHNVITDISPLEELPELESLNLMENEISDISVLDKLPKLKRLALDEVKWISDLSPLERCRGLEELELGDLEYIPEWIAGFKHLKKLSLVHGKIIDISPLSKLTGLMSLNLRSNNISDISPLAGLSELTELYLIGNPVSDITPLFGLAKLKNLLLREDPLSETDIALLKERLPNCRIQCVRGI